jgi:hypothetical protein
MTCVLKEETDVGHPRIAPKIELWEHKTDDHFQQSTNVLWSILILVRGRLAFIDQFRSRKKPACGVQDPH